jgi:hypothetical protein
MVPVFALRNGGDLQQTVQDTNQRRLRHAVERRREESEEGREGQGLSSAKGSKGSKRSKGSKGFAYPRRKDVVTVLFNDGLLHCGTIVGMKSGMSRFLSCSLHGFFSVI